MKREIMENIQKKIEKTFTLKEIKEETLSSEFVARPIYIINQMSLILLLTLCLIFFLGQDFCIQYHPLRMTHDLLRVIPIFIIFFFFSVFFSTYNDYKLHFKRHNMSFWEFLKTRDDNVLKFREEFGGLKRILSIYNELKKIKETISDEEFYMFKQNKEKENI